MTWVHQRLLDLTKMRPLSLLSARPAQLRLQPPTVVTEGSIIIHIWTYQW